jgi:signal transduction histidine kinase
MNQTIQTLTQERTAAKVSKGSAEPVLASYLTHELRAPVTAIRLGLEILQEQVNGRLAPDERQMLALAVKNTNRLQVLVNDIMDYTKIMAGKMALKREALEARSLVSEAVDSLQAWAISKGVRLVKEDGEPLPRAFAESHRIVQILTNLISNAIKFTPARGSVRVSVKEGTGEHQGTLVFRVKDTGCGIAPEDQEKIFKTFEQSVCNGKQSDGTGLGLTLARSMVELHQGRIWVESIKGLGSTFCFSIPVAPEDLVEAFQPYEKPIEYHGILVSVYRRLSAILAAFI